MHHCLQERLRNKASKASWSALQVVHVANSYAGVAVHVSSAHICRQQANCSMGQAHRDSIVGSLKRNARFKAILMYLFGPQNETRHM